jgi:hypothetical protein
MPFLSAAANPTNEALAHLSEKILHRENAEKMEILETEPFESVNRLLLKLFEECD